MSKWRKERKKRGPVFRLKRVNLADIDLHGPIRHDSLPEWLTRMLRWTYRHLGHLFRPTYEQWELGFMRDMHPDREATIWVMMTWAVLEYMKRHPGQDKRAAAGVVLGLSMGESPSDDAGRELWLLFRSLPAEYCDPSSDVYDN